ncbi:MAG: AAA family ATPase, partial [Nostocaceae cyanobacterium]|nr:AAA family ATPase [Nostocaceae cyanobacterium]
LGLQWNEMLHSSGLPLPKYIGTSYLLALVSALYSGSLILLNGSVGVGKTSLIRHSADLLAGRNKIIPVRPAWLDPSDLLGFFDPLSEIFRPSPFLTALKDAKNYSEQIYLVCLDELNLAKIENYGADLLSSLEYSRSEHGKQSLQLYSESIETELWEEAKQLNEEQQRDSKQSQRLRRIQNFLKDYPANFIIPRNIVLMGTLNADETTYDLSPKVIDRSFVITYPPANLTIDGVL